MIDGRGLLNGHKVWGLKRDQVSGPETARIIRRSN